MRRQFAVLGAVALMLSACTSDDEAATPDATSSTASDDTSEAASPEPSASFTPRPAVTPRLPDGFEPPSASGDADADPDPDATETETDDASADAGPSSAPLGSFATSSVAASQSSPFAALAEPVTRPKNVDPTASCQVNAAAGETITACESGFVSSRSDQAFAVVVARDDASGAVSTRLFGDAGGGNMVAAAGVDTGASSLDATHWSRGDELIAFVLGGKQYVAGWDAGAAPKVVASFDGGADLSLVAGRMVERSEGAVRVFAPSTSGSAGTQVTTSAGDPAPIDVSLQVYDKWIAGDWAGMSGLATDSVIAALRSAHTTTDLFVLQGTDCARDGEQAVCTFDSNGDRTTWRLERRDGKVQVVDLK